MMMADGRRATAERREAREARGDEATRGEREAMNEARVREATRRAMPLHVIKRPPARPRGRNLTHHHLAPPSPPNQLQQNSPQQPAAARPIQRYIFCM